MIRIGIASQGQVIQRCVLACALLTLALCTVPLRPVGAQAGSQTAQALLHGAWNAADWPGFLTILDTMGESESVLARKHQGRLNYGWELLASGQCAAAHVQFEKALGLMPGDLDAKRGLAAAERRCPDEVIIVPGRALPSQMTPAPASRPPAPAAGESGGQAPAPAGAPSRHTVQRGETLFGLAQRYGLSVAELQRANGLIDTTVRVGQRLVIPAPSGPTPATGQVRHVVRPDDTLYSIARQHGTSVAAIQQANRLTTDRIRIGQSLVIPAGSGPGAANTHRVAPGDTLYSLARHYGTSVEALRAANGLVDDSIVVGALLTIP